MLQNQQPIQELKRDCWDHKQVHRGNPVSVVAQKRLPTLRRRSPILRHILGYASLADSDAQLEQLAMDPRSTLERVGKADVADQRLNVDGHLRTTTGRF